MSSQLRVYVTKLKVSAAAVGICRLRSTAMLTSGIWLPSWWHCRDQALLHTFDRLRSRLFLQAWGLFELPDHLLCSSIEKNCVHASLYSQQGCLCQQNGDTHAQNRESEANRKKKKHWKKKPHARVPGSRYLQSPVKVVEEDSALPRNWCFCAEPVECSVFGQSILSRLKISVRLATFVALHSWELWVRQFCRALHSVECGKFSKVRNLSELKSFNAGYHFLRQLSQRDAGHLNLKQRTFSRKGAFPQPRYQRKGAQWSVFSDPNLNWSACRHNETWWFEESATFFHRHMKLIVRSIGTQGHQGMGKMYGVGEEGEIPKAKKLRAGRMIISIDHLALHVCTPGLTQVNLVKTILKQLSQVGPDYGEKNHYLFLSFGHPSGIMSMHGQQQFRSVIGHENLNGIAR